MKNTNLKHTTRSRIIKLFYPIVLLAIIFSSCTKDEEDNIGDEPTNGASMQFIAAYNPNEGALLGEDYVTAILNVKIDGLQYSTLSSYYAENNNLWTYSDMGVGNFAMGLHDDFNEDNGVNSYNAQGLFYNLETNASDILPLIEPSEESDYQFFSTSTVRMSENGYVFYISGTNDMYYGDQYKGYLIRYNSATKTYKTAISPDAFALSQPEQGNDTEAALFDYPFFVSNDGRYVYGVLEAYGVDGGALHWDYDILFRYDFETDTYARMGAPGDDNSSLLGITSDDSYLYYYDGGYKIQSLATEQVSELADGSTSIHYPIQWNTTGFCMGATTGIYYYNILSGTNHKVVDEYGTNDAQFDKTGQQIVFTIESSDMKYLCLTKDFNENSTWDTIAGIPYAFHRLVLVK